MRTIFLLTLISLPIFMEAQTGSRPAIRITGTGQTTGHVATARLHNPGEQLVQVVLSRALIPATDSAQGYVLPDDLIVRLAPGQDTLVRLRGYCTNPCLPPAGLGNVLPTPARWGMGRTAPVFEPGAPLPEALGFYPLPDTVRMAFSYPGSNRAVPAWLEFDRNPVSGVNLIVDATRAIESAYQLLEQQGAIHTPYAEHPDRQRDAVVQHTLWHALGTFRGTPYLFDDFRAAMLRQFDAAFSHASPENQATFEQGLLQFWSTFQQLAVTAKVVTKR